MKIHNINLYSPHCYPFKAKAKKDNNSDFAIKDNALQSLLIFQTQLHNVAEIDLTLQTSVYAMRLYNKMFKEFTKNLQKDKIPFEQPILIPDYKHEMDMANYCIEDNEIRIKINTIVQKNHLIKIKDKYRFISKEEYQYCLNNKKIQKEQLIKVLNKPKDFEPILRRVIAHELFHFEQFHYAINMPNALKQFKNNVIQRENGITNETNNNKNKSVPYKNSEILELISPYLAKYKPNISHKINFQWHVSLKGLFDNKDLIRNCLHRENLSYLSDPLETDVRGKTIEYLDKIRPNSTENPIFEATYQITKENYEKFSFVSRRNALFEKIFKH